jgi:hypothetical protein
MHLLAFCLAAAATGTASETVNVADFGVMPNSRVNAVAGVQKALRRWREAEDALLVFPKGRYDFWPQRTAKRVYYESKSYDNNRIISIFPIIPATQKAPAPFHRNTRVEDNVFHAFDYPVLYAKSVDGLTFSNNRIVRSTRYEPYHRRQHMLNLEYCRRVKVDENRLEGDVLGCDVHIENMDASQVTLAPGQGIAGP